MTWRVAVRDSKNLRLWHSQIDDFTSVFPLSPPSYYCLGGGTYASLQLQTSLSSPNFSFLFSARDA